MLNANAVDKTITFKSQRQIDNASLSDAKSLKFMNAGTTVKTAIVNGKEVYAYCFNHALNAPSNGTQLTYNVCVDVGI